MKSAPTQDWQQLHKGFIAIDGGKLHYSRMGQGPSVVMLHASPCSLKVMETVQEEWADEFTCFAFDLPGFGQSDALKVKTLSTEDLADAIAAGMRALNIEKAALYGRHTGGGVAVELAHRHPDLVTMVLTDGFPVFTTPYSEERLAEYLPPITPSWDGGHLTWTWYRYREQHIFWPWDRALQAHRADADLPDVDFIHRGTVELLQAAETYAETYASAFRHAGLKMIDQVEVPVCYGNRPGDSQFKTVKYYPESAWVHIFPRDATQAATQEREVLRKHLAPIAPDMTTWDASTSDVTMPHYIATSAGPLYMRHFGAGQSGRPLVFLPDLPGSIDLHLAEIADLAADRPVFAFDPAGNAHSDLRGCTKISLNLWVQQLGEALHTLGIQSFDLYARGSAAPLALALNEAYPEHCANITLLSPPVFEKNELTADTYAPSICPSEEGAHLLRLWHHLRDQALWFPCNDKRPETIRRDKIDLAPITLQNKAILLLQQPRHYQEIWTILLSYPVAEKLAQHGAKCQIIGMSEDLFGPHLPRAHAIMERQKCQ